MCAPIGFRPDFWLVWWPSKPAERQGWWALGLGARLLSPSQRLPKGANSKRLTLASRLQGNQQVKDGQSSEWSRPGRLMWIALAYIIMSTQAATRDVSIHRHQYLGDQELFIDTALGEIRRFDGAHLLVALFSARFLVCWLGGSVRQRWLSSSSTVHSLN